MKMTPQLEKAQANMVPGVITAEGFLGSDTRTLSTILDEDGQILRQLDLDIQETADRLTYFMDKGRPGLGEPITVDDFWIVKTDEARGHLACPWEDGIHRKINVTVERKDTGEKIFYTNLSIHLLREHGFLEGKGSSFRIEPDQVKAILFR